MKRDKLQQVSLDDRRRRELMMQLIQRSQDPHAATIAWYDGLSDDDKKTLIIGLRIALLEMVISVRNLANSIVPLLGAMVRDIELKNRGNEGK